MQLIKKIVFKFLLLAIILFAMNLVYKSFFLEKDIQRYSALINLVRAVPDDADIIYIGESSNTSFREDDIDKRPISGFISDYYPELDVYDITKPASHAGIYNILLENISERSKVKTIVLTLNLRSFNAQWIYSSLETPLQKSVVLLKPNPALYNRFLLSFKAYDIKTNAERDLQVKEKWRADNLIFPYPFPYRDVIEWDIAMWQNGIRDSLGVKDVAKSQLACHYIKAYAFQIDSTNNSRIKDFNRIIKLAESRGWNLVFNLMAENTEQAEELVGRDLIFLMEENRKWLINYFQSKGCEVADNLNAVEDEQFMDRAWTTEHYGEKGRKTIARNVAIVLKKYHSDEFHLFELPNITPDL